MPWQLRWRRAAGREGRKARPVQGALPSTSTAAASLPQQTVETTHRVALLSLRRASDPQTRILTAGRRRLAPLPSS